MPTAGDLNISLKLDIRPYAESVKTALNIARQFKSQADGLFNLKGAKIDVSKIDGEMKKLDTTLKQYSSSAEKTSQSQKQLNKELSEGGTSAQSQSRSLLATAQSLTIAGFGLTQLATIGVNAFRDLTGEANKLQSAMLGLNSVSKFKGIDPGEAQESIKNLDLVKEGLLTVGEASLALKNLLATGFTLSESINLIKGFGDSAATGRQSSLEFGYAVTSATEGLKNQNSVLVDNAGVTKNLSVILTEAGLSQNDLQRVTSDANVRFALYNGILKETQAQLGEASKYADTFAGKQSKLDASITVIKQNMGIGLQNAFSKYIDLINKSSSGTEDFSTVIQLTTQVAISPMSFAVEALSSALGNLRDISQDVYNVLSDFAVPDWIDETIRKLAFLKRESAQQVRNQDDNVDTRERFDRFGNPIGPVEPDIRPDAKEILAEQGTVTRGGSPKTGRKQNGEKEKISILEEERKKLIDLQAQYDLNSDSLTAQLEILQKISLTMIRIEELSQKDFVNIKNKAAELNNMRSEIEELPTDGVSAFEQTIEDMRKNVISSDEFQTTQLLFESLGDTLRSSLGSAWEEVFGEANNLFEEFMQNIISSFIELAINYAISSLLSSIFPLAGIVPSFFGGSPAGASGAGPGRAAGGLLGGNSIGGFISRSTQVNNYSNSSARTLEVPYIAEADVKLGRLNIALKRQDQLNAARQL